jgi:hypothetical protein
MAGPASESAALSPNRQHDQECSCGLLPAASADGIRPTNTAAREPTRSSQTAGAATPPRRSVVVWGGEQISGAVDASAPTRPARPAACWPPGRRLTPPGRGLAFRRRCDPGPRSTDDQSDRPRDALSAHSETVGADAKMRVRDRMRALAQPSRVGSSVAPPRLNRQRRCGGEAAALVLAIQESVANGGGRPSGRRRRSAASQARTGSRGRVCRRGWWPSNAGEIIELRGSAALPGDPAGRRSTAATAPIRPKRQHREPSPVLLLVLRLRKCRSTARSFAGHRGSPRE